LGANAEVFASERKIAPPVAVEEAGAVELF
jgi:hypothetical protein